jgi:hypothetical protein
MLTGFIIGFILGEIFIAFILSKFENKVWTEEEMLETINYYEEEHRRDQERINELEGSK